MTRVELFDKMRTRLDEAIQNDWPGRAVAIVNACYDFYANGKLTRNDVLIIQGVYNSYMEVQ